MIANKHLFLIILIFAIASALIIFFGIHYTPVSFGNNLQITNVLLKDWDTLHHTCNIQFDISWDNSWYMASAPGTEAKRDAAWIFAKYAVYSNGKWSSWSHCNLINTGFLTPSGSQIQFGKGNGVNKGAFLFHSAPHKASPVNWQGVEIRWNYGIDGVPDREKVKVKVFGIEMVYIPEGILNLNQTISDKMANEFFNDTNYKGAVTQITSEDALGNGAIRWSPDNLNGGVGNAIGDPITSYGSDALNASYPKGYAAFYLMKYEISQGQYVDFLNTLSPAAAAERYPGMYGKDRHTIGFNGVVYSATRPHRACNYLSWMDLCAYADWAALRPMTELEFEKACRGTHEVVPNEFAWGNTTISAAREINHGISGIEDGTEVVTNKGGNCCFSLNEGMGDPELAGGDGGWGPLRGGVFSRPGATRTQSGASYYGVMELSGNVWEQCVTVAEKNSEGTITNAGLFNGSHGDGILTPDGFANVETWPGYSGSKISRDLGRALRGSGWANSGFHLRVSARCFAVATFPSDRSHGRGGRCARTAPF